MRKSFVSILTMLGSFIYLIIASEIIYRVVDKSKTTYIFESYMLVLIIASLLFGILLGGESLVREILKEGKMKINILKLSAIVILFSPIFIYILILIGISVPMPLIFQKNVEILVPSLCILSGYNITTIYKKLEI